MCAHRHTFLSRKEKLSRSGNLLGRNPPKAIDGKERVSKQEQMRKEEVRKDDDLTLLVRIYSPPVEERNGWLRLAGPQEAPLAFGLSEQACGRQAGCQPVKVTPERLPCRRLPWKPVSKSVPRHPRSYAPHDVHDVMQEGNRKGRSGVRSKIATTRKTAPPEKRSGLARTRLGLDSQARAAEKLPTHCAVDVRRVFWLRVGARY